NAPAPPEIYPLSLHDALPIFGKVGYGVEILHAAAALTYQQRRTAGTRDQSGFSPYTIRLQEIGGFVWWHPLPPRIGANEQRYDEDRKSTRLNSSHVKISYAVF